MKIAIKELGEIITGNTPSKKIVNYWDSRDICFVKPDGLSEQGITLIQNSDEYISENARSKARIVSKDAVFVTCIGIIGKVGIASNGDYAFNQQINVVVPNKKVLPKYLAYNLLFSKPRLTAIANAPVVPIINKTQFGEFTICIEENTSKQAEIILILDKISSIINNRKTELEKLDMLIKARFVEMFGDTEKNPMGWEKCTIGECCNLKSGASLPVDKENEGGPIPYVKVGDMNYPGNERYVTTSSHFVMAETAGNGLFEVGSIIFPKRGGAIRTNKKRMTILPICADLNVMGVSTKGKHLPEYLLTFFDMIDLDLLSDGSSVPQINNKNIAPIMICIPPINLQHKFAAFVSQVDKTKLAVQKSLNEAQLLFDSLMQEYFG